MRLQLMRARSFLVALALGGTLLAAAGVARAQTEFASKVQVYVDDDHTEVVSPLVHAQADVTPGTNLSAGYVADIVTSASIDIVTQASKTTIHDVRHQGSFGLKQIVGSVWTVTGSYVYSTENDYASHNFSGGLERRLAENNTTLNIGYAASLDDVQRSGDHNFHKPLTVQSLSLGVTQVLTPRLVGVVNYEYGNSVGFQASPYRFVPVYIDPMGRPTFWVPETDPDSRNRNAFVVGANYHVYEDSAIQGDYRFYLDDWGIYSHTIQLRYLVNYGKKMELRFRERFYTQTGTTFYRPIYGGVEKYMSGDREMSALWSNTFGVKIVRKVAGDVELEGKADIFYFSYPDFPALPTRTGANIGIGVSMSY